MWTEKKKLFSYIQMQVIVMLEYLVNPNGFTKYWLW